MHERVAHWCCLLLRAVCPSQCGSLLSRSCLLLLGSLCSAWGLLCGSLHLLTRAGYHFSISFLTSLRIPENNLKLQLHFPICTTPFPPCSKRPWKYRLSFCCLQPFLPSSTNLLKPLCQSHSELSGFKSSGWCLPSPPWSVFDVWHGRLLPAWCPFQWAHLFFSS